jgi:hypothetical protein
VSDGRIDEAGGCIRTDFRSVGGFTGNFHSSFQDVDALGSRSSRVPA